MVMAGVGGAFRKAVGSLGPAFSKRRDVCGVIGIFQCNEGFEVSRGAYFLPRREIVQLSQSQPQPQLSVLQRFNLESRDDRVCLENVHHPPKCQISKEDAARVLRFVHFEMLKRKLRGISDACISYEQLLAFCIDCAENSIEDESRDIIKLLEQSGTILRLGNTVYLHPEQITRMMESVLPTYVDDSCREELGELEKKKGEIDMESERLVRKELWCGLGFMSLQTIALFRVTFWELSWDVMEPICFYLTSVYCLLGYAFYLKTSKDPTFESFYAARFKIKQTNLMKARNFDLKRYRELQRICRPTFFSPHTAEDAD